LTSESGPRGILDTFAATRFKGCNLKLRAGAARVTDAARTTLVAATCLVFRFS
jgi:hypothetical protein